MKTFVRPVDTRRAHHKRTMVMVDKWRLVRGQRLYCMASCIFLPQVIWERVFLTVVCLSILSVAGMAQERGSISGIIQHTGEGVPGHRIMLKCIELLAKPIRQDSSLSKTWILGKSSNILWEFVTPGSCTRAHQFVWPAANTVQG